MPSKQSALRKEAKSKMLHILQALIYPHKCMFCGSILNQDSFQALVQDSKQSIMKQNEDLYTCPSCRLGGLNYNICQKCGKPYAIDKNCIFCTKLNPYIERLIAAFPYRGIYKKAIWRWKYSGTRRYAKGFAIMLLPKVQSIETIDCMIPVPLSKRRQKQRGFNQAKDLALELSKLTGIPTEDVLIRYKNTKPQSTCTEEQRKKNLYNSIKFKNNNNLKQGIRHIALIDDIYTSGNTINECIRVIRDKYQHDNIKIYVIAACITL